MTYPPAPGSNDPYGQQNPYGQQPDPYANPYGAAPGSPAEPQYGPPQPQSPYAQPYPAAPQQTNTMAILALVFAFVFSPLAIVFGHMAKKQIRERGEGGDALATAGLILGYIFTGLAVAVCCGSVFLAAISSSTTS